MHHWHMSQEINVLVQFLNLVQIGIFVCFILIVITKCQKKGKKKTVIPIENNCTKGQIEPQHIHVL